MGTEQWLRGLIVVYNGRGREEEEGVWEKNAEELFFCTECLCRGWGGLERDFGVYQAGDEFKE